MTTRAPLPVALQVRELLTDLVGLPVTVGTGSPVDLTSPVETGVYVDDALVTVAVAVLDLRLAAALGAAIGLLPQATVEAADEQGELGPALRENVREVLNVAAALLNGEDLTHVRLYSTHAPGAAPADAVAHAATLGRRLDLAVRVGHYDGGRLSLVLVRPSW